MITNGGITQTVITVKEKTIKEMLIRQRVTHPVNVSIGFRIVLTPTAVITM